MGNAYSADHIAKDHIHTDITCNTREPQQKYRLGTVSNRLLGVGGLNAFYWIQSLALSFCSDSKRFVRMKATTYLQ